MGFKDRRETCGAGGWSTHTHTHTRELEVTAVQTKERADAAHTHMNKKHTHTCEREVTAVRRASEGGCSTHDYKDCREIQSQMRATIVSHHISE